MVIRCPLALRVPALQPGLPAAGAGAELRCRDDGALHGNPGGPARRQTAGPADPADADQHLR